VFNDATQLRICVANNAAFTAWSGDGAIVGRCVTIDFANGAEVPLVWPLRCGTANQVKGS
jgi:hypothetical protein